MSKASSFGRFVGEEVWFSRLDEDARWDSRRGVLTSSVFNVSAPRRLTDCTILSSRTVPLAFTFLDLEAKDIMGSWEPAKKFR